MSIQTQIERLDNVKSKLRTNIAEKGVDVPADADFDECAELVKSINNNGPIESGQCGENVFWELYENGLLVISGSGAMYDYASSSSSPFRQRKDITDVIIKNGVTTIGVSLFSQCSYIENVVIPNGVEQINRNAFAACESLKAIAIPPSCTKIAYQTFAYCVSLSRIVIPDSVTIIENSVVPEGLSTKVPLDIFYTGTKEQWDSIAIGEDNGRLSAATLHCEYETNADTVDGWHIAVRDDGSDPPHGITNTLTFVYTVGG